jgi:hypothetical protein
VTYLLDTNAISDLMRAAPRIENWMAGLEQADRVVTCTIGRGEILYGIARIPAGKRRTELEETGQQFLAAVPCDRYPQAPQISTRPLRWRANSVASRWTKTISGWLRQHWPGARHWLAATATSHVLMAW